MMRSPLVRWALGALLLVVALGGAAHQAVAARRDSAPRNPVPGRARRWPWAFCR